MSDLKIAVMLDSFRIDRYAAMQKAVVMGVPGTWKYRPSPVGVARWT